LEVLIIEAEVTIDRPGVLRLALSCRSLATTDSFDPDASDLVSDELPESALPMPKSPTREGDKEGTGTRWVVEAFRALGGWDED